MEDELSFRSGRRPKMPNLRASARWTPREIVWLMVLLRDARAGEGRAALLERLRARLVASELHPA